MKMLVALGLAITLILCSLSACKPGNEELRIPIPPGTIPASINGDSPEDIVVTPGGRTYRANVHEPGEENPWPPIPVISSNITTGSEQLTFYYRAPFDSMPGETHPLIVIVTRPGAPFFNNETLTLYTINMPEGIGISNGGVTGLLSTLGAVLVIDVSLEINPGSYTFQIGVEIDGVYYGSFPCTINVVK